MSAHKRLRELEAELAREKRLRDWTNFFSLFPGAYRGGGWTAVLTGGNWIRDEFETNFADLPLTGVFRIRLVNDSGVDLVLKDGELTKAEWVCPAFRHRSTIKVPATQEDLIRHMDMCWHTVSDPCSDCQYERERALQQSGCSCQQ